MLLDAHKLVLVSCCRLVLPGEIWDRVGHELFPVYGFQRELQDLLSLSSACKSIRTAVEWTREAALDYCLQSKYLEVVNSELRALLASDWCLKQPYPITAPAFEVLATYSNVPMVVYRGNVMDVKLALWSVLRWQTEECALIVLPTGAAADKAGSNLRLLTVSRQAAKKMAAEMIKQRKGISAADVHSVMECMWVCPSQRCQNLLQHKTLATCNLLTGSHEGSVSRPYAGL